MRLPFALVILYIFFVGPPASTTIKSPPLSSSTLIIVSQDTNYLRRCLDEYGLRVTLTVLFPEADIYSLRAIDRHDDDRLVQLVRKTPAIRSWCKNYIVHLRQIPNDPLLPHQWYMDNTSSAATIDRDLDFPLKSTVKDGLLTPKGDTIVAIVHDREVYGNHPDLVNALHRNIWELPGNNQDDDNNTYTDDVFGYNFRTATSKVFTNPHPHGTAVAGILAATPNNTKGIIGASVGGRIMFTTKGSDVVSILAAHHYAYQLRETYNNSGGEAGVFVVAINASWGVSGLHYMDALPWCTVYDRLGEVGILTVAAAPNDRFDVDEQGDMPTTCPSHYLLTVGATGDHPVGALISGYGAGSIDVAAPGQNILTLSTEDDYRLFEGTSAAAPLVSGLVAYLYSLNSCSPAADPAGTALRVKKAILQGVRLRPNLYGRLGSSGIINYAKAAQWYTAACPPPPATHLNLPVRLYPNPARERATLAFTLEEAAIVSYHLTTSTGQELHFDQSRVLPPGEHRLTFFIGGLPPAVYYLTFITPKQSLTKRLIVQ